MVATNSEKLRVKENKRIDTIRALPLHECNLTKEDWWNIYRDDMTPEEQNDFSKNGNLTNILKYCVDGNHILTDGLLYDGYMHLYRDDGLVMFVPDVLDNTQLARVTYRPLTARGIKQKTKRKIRRRKTLKKKISR